MTRFSNALQSLAGIFGLFGVQSLHVAQCAQPDSLDGGPCCALATESAPLLDFTQDALQICWLDCSVEQVMPCRAEWHIELHSKRYHNAALGPCSPRFARLRLLDASGGVKLRGRLGMQYSRTWLETDPSGSDHQVWRFLVNGDLEPGPSAGLPPCELPGCIPPLRRARFTGYVDYARECSTGSFQFAWMLAHVCDFVDHHSGFPRAGIFHPDRSYTFVGPALGFVPGPLQPAETSGGSPFEAVREIRVGSFSGGGTNQYHVSCRLEEQSSHSLLPGQQLCLCTGSSGPPQFSVGDLAVAGSCGTSLTTPGGTYLPGFLSMGIGAWTDPTRFPGEETLRWNAGDYLRTRACDSIAPEREVCFGVTTIGGWAGTQILSSGLGLPLPVTYMDQGSSKRHRCFDVCWQCCVTGGGLYIPKPIMNLPYVSDFVLNLNH